MVFSQAAQGRELKTLEKAQAKELEKARKEWRKREGQTFNCQADAEKALVQFNRKWKYQRAVAQAIPVRQYSRRGRPTAQDQMEMNATVPAQRRKSTQRPTIRWIFQLFEGLDLLLV